MSKRDKSRARQGNRETGRQGDRETGRQESRGADGQAKIATPDTQVWLASGGSAATMSAPSATLGMSGASDVEPTSRTRFPWRQYLIPALALLGSLDSIYLSYVKIAHAKPFCSGLGDCETVNSSAYSTFGGIPIAFLGVGMYAVVFMLAMWGPKLPGLLAAYAPLLIFGMALGGVLYSAYLTYLELYVIEAICIYCVGSAILITLIFLTSLWFLMRGQPINETA